MRAYFDLNSGHYMQEKVPAGVWSVAVAKKSGLVVKKNAGASLVDIGDGVGRENPAVSLRAQPADANYCLPPSLALHLTGTASRFNLA